MQNVTGTNISKGIDSVLDIDESPGHLLTICLSAVMAIASLIGFLSFAALAQTKNIPKVSRFISCGLLLFDSVTLVCLISRKYVPSTAISNSLFVAGITTAFLSYCTITLMSVERYVVIAKPFLYYSQSKRRVYNIITVMWIILGVFMYACPPAVCIVTSGRATHNCTNNVVVFVVIVFTTTTIVTSNVSLICTCRIIKSSWSFRGQVTTRALKRSYMYKSVIVVTTSVISVTLIGSGYCFTSILVEDITVKRFIFDIVSVVNTLSHSFLYVFWYKRCRDNMLKMLLCHKYKSDSENIQPPVRHSTSLSILSKPKENTS